MKHCLAVVVIFIAGLLLTVTSGCDSSKKEADKKALEESRKQAVQGLQRVAERNRRAKRIIKKKFDAMSRSDSRFKDYAPVDDSEESGEIAGSEEGTVTGSVTVWGDEPGARGSLKGITVILRYDANGSSQRTRVDSQNRYAFSAPPGDYTLIIDETEYRYFEKYIIVDPGTERVVSPIHLKKE